MCPGNRADSQSISKCAREIQMSVSIGYRRGVRARENFKTSLSPTIYLSSGRWARACCGGWETRQIDTRHGHTLSSLFSLLRLSGPHRGAISSTTALAVPPSAVDEISIHHSHSSQSISIYDRENRAKISVSVSISRFLRL